MHDVVVNVLDCDIEVRELEICLKNWSWTKLHLKTDLKFELRLKTDLKFKLRLKTDLEFKLRLKIDLEFKLKLILIQT